MNISRREAIGLVAGAAAVGAMRLFTSVAFAADTADILSDEYGFEYGPSSSQCQNSGYFRIRHNGKEWTGFCATPWVSREETYGNNVGVKRIGTFNNDGYAVDNDLLLRALYYGAGANSTPDGPKYIAGNWAEAHGMPTPRSVSDRHKDYIAAHMLVSYALWRARLIGINGWGEYRVRACCATTVLTGDAFASWASSNIWDTIVPRLRALPAVPSAYEAYAVFPSGWPDVENPGHQVLVWGEGAPVGYLRVRKDLNI